MKELSTMVELSGAELDAVAAGLLVIPGSLINVDVDADIDVGDVLSQNATAIGVQAAVAALGAAAGNLGGVAADR
jgi:hypothetical protein